MSLAFTNNEQFKARFAARIAAAKDRASDLVRKSSLELLGMMIDASPVGNPDLWLSLHPRSDINTQKESHWKGPDGYVGGRFKNNWNCGVGYLDMDTIAEPNASGDDAMAKAEARLKSWEPGQTIMLTNSMPYAFRLENGWSRQAPFGMVKTSVIMYSDLMAAAAAKGAR